MSHRDSVAAPPAGARVTAGSPATPIAAFEDPGARPLRRPVPPRGRAHAARAGGAEELPLRRRRRAADLDGRGRDRGAGRADPGAGRPRPRALRALRRRRLGGRRAARAQGGRRPAHLRLRRPRPAAQGRGDAGGRDLRGPLPRAARARRRRRSGSSRGSTASPTPRRSARRSARSSSASSRRRRSRLGEIRYLVQGTLYSDVIESGGDATASRRRSSRHHNVGGLPEDMEMELVEPLRLLFKDEVRRVGEELGLPERMVWRQPFPGPGLAIRIIGEVTRERLEILREADAILQEEIRRAGPLPRALAVVRRAAGDPLGRRPGRRAHLRLPDRRSARSRRDDAMTADWARLPYDLLETISSRIVNEIPAREPRRARHHLEAAGDDRVGVSLGGVLARAVALVALAAVALAGRRRRPRADDPGHVGRDQGHADRRAARRDERGRPGVQRNRLVNATSSSASRGARRSIEHVLGVQLARVREVEDARRRRCRRRPQLRVHEVVQAARRLPRRRRLAGERRRRAPAGAAAASTRRCRRACHWWIDVVDLRRVDAAGDVAAPVRDHLASVAEHRRRRDHRRADPHRAGVADRLRDPVRERLAEAGREPGRTRTPPTRPAAARRSRCARRRRRPELARSRA